jgi:hypothetical protein
MLATDPTFAARAYEVHRTVLRLRGATDRIWLELGLLLKQVRDEELWRPLQFESFAAYLADPELSISHTAAYRVIAVAEGFQRHLTASPAGTTGIGPDAIAALGTHKAALLAPVVADCPPAEAAEWVAKAATLTTSDLRRELRRAQGRDTDTAAWLDILGHQLAALARKLGDTAEPRAVLDDISNRTIAALARLEREAE